MCRLHYERWRRWNNPNTVKKRRQKGCDKCEKRHYSKGLCKSHYEKERYRSKGVKICKICNNNHFSKGYCRKCYHIYAKEELMNIIDSEKKCRKCGINDSRVLRIRYKRKGWGKAFENRYKMHLYYIKHRQKAKGKLELLCANCVILNN